MAIFTLRLGADVEATLKRLADAEERIADALEKAIEPEPDDSAAVAAIDAEATKADAKATEWERATTDTTPPAEAGKER